MAFINSTNTKMLYADQAFESYLRTVTPSAAIDMLEVTSLADTSKAYVPGLLDYSLNLDGMFDDSASATSVWTAITTPIGASTSVVTSVAPSGFAVSNPVWLIPARTVNYEVQSQVADVVTFSMSIGSSDTASTGVSLASLTALTATGTGTSVDNAAATSNGFVAHIHVTASAGTTPTMTALVQHSTNNSTWTTLGTFTAVTGTTSQRIAGTGTVNRYARISYTIGGTTPSFTTQISLSRL